MATIGLPRFSGRWAGTLRHSLGAEDYQEWFARHLVDPRPVIRKLIGVA